MKILLNSRLIWEFIQGLMVKLKIVQEITLLWAIKLVLSKRGSMRLKNGTNLLKNGKMGL